jgi:hypothetical protein
MSEKEINTINKFAVGVQGEDIRVLGVVSRMTPNDALLLAAWLVCLADGDADFKFEDVLKAVKNT